MQKADRQQRVALERSLDRQPSAKSGHPNQARNCTISRFGVAYPLRTRKEIGSGYERVLAVGVNQIVNEEVTYFFNQFSLSPDRSHDAGILKASASYRCLPTIAECHVKIC